MKTSNNDNTHENIKTNTNNNINQKAEVTTNSNNSNENAQKTKISRKVINILQYIIIIILIVLIAYYSYQKFILQKKYVPFFNHNFFIILSGSMETTINTKDLIVTSPKDTYEKGDIIAFNQEETVTVHRIIDVKNEDGTKSYVTKGDNNNAEDLDEVKNEDILGAYNFTIPILGGIIIFFATNPILLIVLIVALVLIYFIIKLLKQNYNENKNIQTNNK